MGELVNRSTITRAFGQDWRGWESHRPLAIGNIDTWKRKDDLKHLRVSGYHFSL
jgi:hypothetical protein